MLQYWEEDKQRMIKLFGPDRYVMLAIDLREVLRAHGMLPYRPPGWVDPLGEDQFNIMKEWNLKKHHQQMIDNKRAAAQRRLEELNCRGSEQLAPCCCTTLVIPSCVARGEGPDWCSVNARVMQRLEREELD